MPFACIIEFERKGLDGPALYDAVNKALDLDLPSDRNVPDGLEVHVPVDIDPDHFMVFEVWASQAQQEAFMQDRLHPAFVKAEAPQPTKVLFGDALLVFHTH